MTRHYGKYIAFFAALLTTTFLTSQNEAIAQLNGTYTIGASGADYPDFASAIESIRSAGVSGAVTFKIAPGTYTERLKLRQVAGSSAANPISFEPANGPNTVTIQETSDVEQTDGGEVLGFYVVLLDSVQNVSFKNIAFAATGSNHVIFKLTGNCSSVTLSGNKFTSPQAQPSQQFIPYYSQLYLETAGQFDGISIENNSFVNGAYGINEAGSSQGLLVSGNSFQGQLQASIFISGANKNTVIDANTIFGSAVTRAISLANSTGTSRISRNKVTANFSNGLYVQSSGEAANPMLIYNNAIMGGTGSFTGIFSNNNRNIRYYYNTVTIGSLLENSSAFYAGNDSALTVRNNILTSGGKGVALSISNYSVAYPDFDYNDYFSTGAALFLSPTQTPIASLAAYQTASGWDAHALNLDPFLQTGDYHTFNANLKGKGVIVNGITTDLDGDPRTGNTDIGADEFLVYGLDAGIVAADNSVFYCAPATPYNIMLVNNGTTTITSLRIDRTLDGVPQSFIAWTGSIAPGAQALYAVGDETITAGSQHTLSFVISQVNGSTDAQPANNTLSETFTVYPKISLGQDISTCEESKTLTSSGPYSAYQWYRDNIAVSTDSALIVSANGAYALQATDAHGCVSRDTISFITHYFAVGINITKSPFLCGGDTIVLKAFPVNPAFTYAWSIDGVIVPDSTESHFVAMNAGNYTVAAGDGTCTYTSEPLPISVTPAIPISIQTAGALTTCSNDPIVLEASPANDDVYTYQWTKDDTTVQGPQSSTLTVDETGDYTVTIFRQLCSYTSPEVHVDVLPAPEASITGVVNELSAPAGGDLYRWFVDGELVSSGTANHITAEVSGIYTVEVTAGICKSVSPEYPLVFTGVDDPGEMITLYPNPTSRRITIHGASAPVMLQVEDAVGRVATPPSYLNGDDTIVDLYGMSSGIYLFRIRVGKLSVVKKVVVN